MNFHIEIIISTAILSNILVERSIDLPLEPLQLCFIIVYFPTVLLDEIERILLVAVDDEEERQ